VNRRFTASSAAIAKRCLYSWRDDVTVSPIVANEAMERGTRGHAACAKMLQGKEFSAEEGAEFGQQLSAVSRLVSHIGHDRAWTIFVEPAFAWSPGYGCRFLGEDINREYDAHGAEPWDICGSADILLVDGDEGILVDLKFSNSIDDLNTKYHDQLAVLSAMASNVFGLKTIKATTFNPDSPAPLDGINWLTFDWLDFDETGAWLNGFSKAVENSAPNPGDWCAFCPARTGCPATRQALAEAPKWDIATAEDVARYYPKIGPIYDLLEEIRLRCREVVEREGAVDLANGKRLVVQEMPGREGVNIGKLEEGVVAELRERGIITKGEPFKTLRMVGGKKR
jgi:hypothetical protein